jgi:hypothetical protein
MDAFCTVSDRRVASPFRVCGGGAGDREMSAPPLTALERALERSIETLWVGSVLVEEFGPNAPQELQKNM